VNKAWERYMQRSEFRDATTRLTLSKVFLLHPATGGTTVIECDSPFSKTSPPTCRVTAG
jgi:hypothetical protein